MAGQCPHQHVKQLTQSSTWRQRHRETEVQRPRIAFCVDHHCKTCTELLGQPETWFILRPGPVRGLGTYLVRT
ncbi:hypothetical protein IMY05_009G0048200 [Salix suchowensis]|nr:hypothetical protein IMY05_009G0048200 [Salix suchowensis]